MMLIGEFSESPKTCGAEHLPSVFNSSLGYTICICGEQKWEADKGSWKSRTLYDSYGRDAKVIGYDVYYLPPLEVTS